MKIECGRVPCSPPRHGSVETITTTSLGPTNAGDGTPRSPMAIAPPREVVETTKSPASPRNGMVYHQETSRSSFLMWNGSPRMRNGHYHQSPYRDDERSRSDSSGGWNYHQTPVINNRTASASSDTRIRNTPSFPYLPSPPVSPHQQYLQQQQQQHPKRQRRCYPSKVVILEQIFPDSNSTNNNANCHNRPFIAAESHRPYQVHSHYSARCNNYSSFYIDRHAIEPNKGGTTTSNVGTGASSSAGASRTNHVEDRSGRDETTSRDPPESTDALFRRNLKWSLAHADESAVFALQRTLLESNKKRHWEDTLQRESLVWQLVDAIQAIRTELISTGVDRFHKIISMDNIEDMVISTTAFLKTYHSFRCERIPHRVDIGYVYYWRDVKSGTLKPITPLCVHAAVTGIYTGDDPLACYPYPKSQEGECSDASSTPDSRDLMGVMVARIQGTIRTSPSARRAEYGTSIRTKRLKPPNSNHHQLSSISVLAKSEQSLTLLRFAPANRILGSAGNATKGTKVLSNYHNRIQKVLNEYMNETD